MSRTRRNPGSLGPYVDGYHARLVELGYSTVSVTRSLTALGYLGRWMDRQDIAVERLNDNLVRGVPGRSGQTARAPGVCWRYVIVGAPATQWGDRSRARGSRSSHVSLTPHESYRHPALRAAPRFCCVAD
jgi:hypothetical protein